MTTSKKTAAVMENTKVAARSMSVVIEQPVQLSVCLEVTGESGGILQNNFSQKSVDQMLRTHMGLNVPKEAKVPIQVIEDAKVKNKAGRICIPPTAFKKAMLNAAAVLKTFKKTHLRTQIFIEGQSVPITFEEETPRMDIVRVGMNRPDIRFRPLFTGWKARIRILFSDTLAVQSVVDLLNRAGKVGVGEWRPEKDGTFGTFYVSRHISDPKEIAEVVNECRSPLISLVIPEWAMNTEITPEILSKIARGAQAEESDVPHVEDETEEHAAQ